MISDSITNASPTSAPTSNGFGKKKKRNNKSSAKLKQSKLDLRREQWLSQVALANKEEKSVVNRSEQRDDDDKPVENLDNVGGGDVHHHHHHEESFMESPSNSSVGRTDSSNNFSRGSSSRSSSSSSGFCSGNITEEENVHDDDDDDGCVDDWEAVADALAAEEEENEKEKENLVQESALNVVDSSDVKDDSLGMSSSSSRKQKSNRAWRLDDDHRPQGLPNLSKQLSFPELDKRFRSVTVPSPCPICCEELDLTDSNFLPCPCGFSLCLFCHKTICDGDGRCPGCRKPYDRNAYKAETSIQSGGLTIRLARSSSMFCKF